MHEIQFCQRRHIQNLSEVLKISSVQPGTNFRVFYPLKPTVHTFLTYFIVFRSKIIQTTVGTVKFLARATNLAGADIARVTSKQPRATTLAARVTN